LQIANILDKSFPYDVKFDFVQMRLFAVALRENEWKIAFQNIHDKLNSGGLFQALEICPLVSALKQIYATTTFSHYSQFYSIVGDI
jgi:hypothetical protein